MAWAFAALMRRGTWSRAELKMECLRRVRQWKGTGLRKEMLINWIETYVQFSEEDAAEYQLLLERKQNKEIRHMALTWLGKAEARGIEQGLEKGLKKGRREGKAEAIDQMRQLVLGRIEQRFGRVPEQVQAKVQSAATLAPLAAMLEKLPLLESADDLLSPRRRRSNGHA